MLVGVNWRFFALVVTGHKLFVLACGLVGLLLFAPEVSLVYAVSAWDTVPYLHLAKDGYQTGDSACAFYPLLPLLIRCSAPLFGGNHVYAGVFLANVFSVVALFLFFRFVQVEHGEAAAKKSLLALLAFPTALFFSVIYTETLFLLQLMLVFFGMRQNRLTWVVVAAFLMPLTKAIGIFVTAVLAWHWLEHYRQRNGLAHHAPWLGVAFVPLLGWTVFLFLMWKWTGDSLEAFKAQRFYPYQPSILNIFSPQKWGPAFLKWGSLHESMNSILDRGCFVLLLGSLYPIWKLDKKYFIWALFAGVIPALTNCFFSYSRYILSVFPLFILFGIYFSRPARHWVFWYYFVLMLAFQSYLIVRFVNHLWAG